MLIQLLSSRQIVQFLPYKITNPVILDQCFESIKTMEELHSAASLLLYNLPKESYSEYPIASSLCITDAFLRTNNKKISLSFVGEAKFNRSQQIAKTVILMKDILYDKIPFAEIQNWFLWHIIDMEYDDDIWDFHENENDLISILVRFTHGDQTKQQILSECA